MQSPINVISSVLLAGCLTAAWAGDCSCAAARKSNAWCGECGVGYIASIRIPSRILFEVLDAHGHDIDPKRLWCEACASAFETGGYCERCGIGFFRKQAYLSRLAYTVATGELRDPATIRCATCRKNANDHGWCEACGIGMVGSLALRHRDDLERTAKAFDLLRRAVRALSKCEACSVAIFSGGRCPFCRVSYQQPAPR